ncbi:PilZ domain-containing protein [Marinobacter sp.]|uniref:PilZ domain-containing protein n=1 Tax=Marinobacter sp. TaxID=50741 RepID=UPI001B5781FA|nr:PilZ domain-containing protein [Marinobacter sp.]MBQ0834704.1 PilZ domain-containing protein [Marinobacter sp.]
MSKIDQERRRHRRSGIRVPVELSYADTTIETRTLNMSASGLRLKRPNGLFIQPGEAIDISFQGASEAPLSALVAHMGKSHIGIQFDEKRFTGDELRELYDLAPVWQRLLVRSKRRLWRDSRRIGVFLANTLLRSLIVRLVQPQFIFAVYGNRRDTDTYWSPKMAERMPPNLVLGFIRNQKARGLLVASQTLEHELQADSDKVRRYIDQLQQDFPNAKRFALVGRLPTFAKKAGIDISDPLVEGSLGTRYMIRGVAQQMQARPQYSRETSIVVLGGAGRIGNAVCEDLTGLYETVIAYDPRYERDEEITTEQGTIVRTSNLARLKDQKLYIGLMSRGDLVLDLYQHIPCGSLIADDTHPCISLHAREKLQESEIAVEKVVLSHPEFLMWPRMPAWNHRDIPGCLVEALVLLQHPELEGDGFLSFCQHAEGMGFSGRLIKPLAE